MKSFNDNMIYININKWSISCSLIGLFIAFIFYLFPYFLYKSGVITRYTFFLFVLVIFIFALLSMLMYCNYPNALFITNNAIQ